MAHGGVDEECCICLQPLFPESQQCNSQGDPVSLLGSKGDVGVLRCGHVMHFTCGTQQLEHKKSCPMCRANLSCFPENERIVHVALGQPRTAEASSNLLHRYAEKLSRECQDFKKKSLLLEQRKTAMRLQEEEMLSTIKSLQDECERAQRLQAVLQGKWQRELTARAEAEQLKLLQQCAKETRQSLLTTRQTHAIILRELNELGLKMDQCRERIAIDQQDNGVNYKRLRSETIV